MLSQVRKYYAKPALTAIRRHDFKPHFAPKGHFPLRAAARIKLYEHGHQTVLQFYYSYIHEIWNQLPHPNLQL